MARVERSRPRPGSPDYLAWRSTLLDSLHRPPSRLRGFTHFIAINVVVAAEHARDDVVCFRPDHASITCVEAVNGGLRLIELGRRSGIPWFWRAGEARAGIRAAILYRCIERPLLCLAAIPLPLRRRGPAHGRFIEYSLAGCRSSASCSVETDRRRIPDLSQCRSITRQHRALRHTAVRSGWRGARSRRADSRNPCP